MKSPKLITLVFGSILILLLDSSIICAQKSHFSLSFSPVLPLRNLKEHASWGFISARINYSYDLTKKFSWSLSASYNKFGSETVTVDFLTDATYESNLTFIPLISGFKYFINENNTRFYIIAEGGYYFPASDFEEGDWGVSPGAGMQIPIQGNNMKVDISLMYNRVFGSTTTAFTAYSKFGGSVTSQTWFEYTSYLAVNVGIVFGQ